jgi:hypothetical protein
MRYMVFDDTPQGKELGWTADSFAAALRTPLAVIGVRVVRRPGLGSGLGTGGLQGGEHLSPNAYKAKAEKVARVVEATLSFRPPRG